MKYMHILGLLAFICFAACEDMEDTYDEFTGDGPIRYLAKCTNVTVESGWERLVVKWQNELDPNRNGVWVQCKSDTYQFDTIVPADSTSCDVRGLVDGMYNVTVAAVSENGDTSLTAIGSGRPYTYSHEAVLGFTRGIQKFVFVQDRLVLFLGLGSNEMIDFAIEYTDTDGQPQRQPLRFNNWITINTVVENVDVTQPVVLTRLGMLEGCSDTIAFPDYELDPTIVNMAVDFQNRLLERYGEVDLEREELELDYDLSSLEDILYFPNLKTLKLGANRYYGQRYGNPTSSLSQDPNGSLASFAIEQLAIVNPELRVINYGNQYGLYPGWPACIENGGFMELPADLQLLDTTGFVIVNSTESVTLDDNGSMLLDDNPTTVWESAIAQERRSYNLDIDMQEVKTVKGLKIVQASVTTQSRNYKPTSLGVSVSVDGRTWINPCHTEQNTLGNGNGEAKLLDFANEQNVRYIRLTLQDEFYDGNNGCILGDVLPY